MSGEGTSDGVLETVVYDATNGVTSEHWYGASVDTLEDCVRITLNRKSSSDGLNTASNTYSARYCNMLPHAFSYASDTAHWYINNQIYLFLPVSYGTTLEEIGAWVADNPIQIYVPYATPTPITTDPVEMTTLDGDNTIFTDADSLTVTYHQKVS